MATNEQRDAVLAYVGARASSATDQAFAAAKYDEASALVLKYVGGAEQTAVPEEIVSGAILDVAAALWARKGAPQGQAQFDTIDSAPVSQPRDPMVSVYPVLNRFLEGGFA